MCVRWKCQVGFVFSHIHCTLVLLGNSKIAVPVNYKKCSQKTLGLHFLLKFLIPWFLPQLFISFSLDLIKKFFNKFHPQAPKKRREFFGENCFSIVFPSQQMDGWWIGKEIYWAQLICHTYDTIIFDANEDVDKCCMWCVRDTL